MLIPEPIVSRAYVTYSKNKCSKISNTFLLLFSNKIMVIRASIDKLLVRIANREDPDQTASSDLGLSCLTRPNCRGVEIVKFSTCPGTSKKLKCTCPLKFYLSERNELIPYSA